MIFQSIRRLRCLLLMAILVASVCVPAGAPAAVMGFGDFSQFTLNQNDGGSPPTISGGTIELTNGGSGEARSLYYNTPQNITSFTASFTYETPANGSTVFDFDPSAAFVIQNSPQGLHAVGSGGETFAYSGIPDSAAVSLQLGGSGSSGSSGTGLFTDGNVTTAASTAPVLLTNGDPIDVVLSYSGNRLTETLTDTVTDATFNTTYLTNLESAIGGPTAYVGFTAATDNSGTQFQYLSDFEFSNSAAVPEPSSVVLLAMGTVAASAISFRRLKRFGPLR